VLVQPCLDGLDVLALEDRDVGVPEHNQLYQLLVPFFRHLVEHELEPGLSPGLLADGLEVFEMKVELEVFELAEGQVLWTDS
jgi:hypothetical protein